MRFGNLNARLAKKTCTQNQSAGDLKTPGINPRERNLIKPGKRVPNNPNSPQMGAKKGLNPYKIRKGDCKRTRKYHKRI